MVNFEIPFCIAAMALFVTNLVHAAEEGSQSVQTFENLRKQMKKFHTETNFEFASNNNITSIDANLNNTCDIDERVRVTATKQYPHNAIVKLRTPSGCSGSFILPRTVITAAHCLYSRTKSSFKEGVQVCPGRDDETFPYGCQWASSYAVPSEYVRGDWDFDFALLLLPKKFEGIDQYFELAGPEITDAVLTKRNKIWVAGYPGGGERTPKGDLVNGKNLFKNHGPISNLTPSQIQSTTIKRGGGMSGGPVWVKFPNKILRTLVGVVSRAKQIPCVRTEQRVNSFVRNFVATKKNRWKSFPCQSNCFDESDILLDDLEDDPEFAWE